MGPGKASSLPPSGQERGSTRSKAKWSGRPRLCLLKGCERWFIPSHPLGRYCGDLCREEARRWQNWRAQQDYRVTDHGRRMRRDQSRRRRARLKERQKTEESGTSECGQAQGASRLSDPRVGHQYVLPPGFFSCRRPGCYELFTRTKRTPKKRFCCASCRNALRRVELRERRFLRKKAGRNRQRPLCERVRSLKMTHIM